MGKKICYKFLKNQCERSSEDCIYKHQTGQNVRTSLTPHQDFPSLPTTRPVVWSQVAAEGTQAQDLPHLLEGVQNKSKTLEAQVLQTLTQMMPQISQQLVTALRTGMTTN